MPSVDLPSGQWTMVQPMKGKINLQGLLPFKGGLLTVGELKFLLLSQVVFPPGKNCTCVL